MCRRSPAGSASPRARHSSQPIPWQRSRLTVLLSRQSRPYTREFARVSDITSAGDAEPATVSETIAMAIADETNPWEAQRARFNLAAQKLNLDEGLWKVLSHPNRELTVYIPVQMDDGHLEVF